MPLLGHKAQEGSCGEVFDPSLLVPSLSNNHDNNYFSKWFESQEV